MIKVKRGTAPTEKLVTKIIKKFQQHELPRFEQLEKYYQVKNNILNRPKTDRKPNNKMAHGFAKYIANMATGYFMGEGVRVETADEGYKALLDELNAMDMNFEIAKEMSKKGIAFELLYMNEQSEIRSRYFKAEEMIPIYSYAVDEFLEFAIRLWQEEDLLEEKTVNYAEVYTKDEIILFQQVKKDKKYIEVQRDKHYFGDVPVVVYWNNEERTGDYEDVITLIDAYDKTQSDTANDFEYFTDAFLVIVGAAGGLENVTEDDEEGKKAAKTLRNERILFLDEKGQAQWLIKEVNDTAVENFKNRIAKDIFFLSLVPALTDESFAGNLTGVAIKYKMIGLEQLAAIKEKKFLPSYKKKLRIVTRMFNLRLNRNYDANSVETKFDRNMISNIKELAEIVALLDGIISKESQYELLPFIKNVRDELSKALQDKLKEREYQELGNIDSDKIDAYVAAG
ncbi:phage portal protein [Metasolibacillus meyeri]|uniref:phage portal protein n=1 Tax=Metasolibacillus meyeri TaxID=1071052 RepID=UPI00187D54DF|nr:phage portal protein [Metasolibacillus meyeri]